MRLQRLQEDVAVAPVAQMAPRNATASAMRLISTPLSLLPLVWRLGAMLGVGMERVAMCNDGPLRASWLAKTVNNLSTPP
jgi:hypothetical protein